MKVPVKVSKRHVHLTEVTYKKLFGNRPLEVRNYLGNPEQFASTATVALKWNNQIIERLRLVGPFRDYDQVELSETDAKMLGINPPKRRSGDLANSLPMVICGPAGELTIPQCCILVIPHIHFSEAEAAELNLKNQDTFKIFKDGLEILEAEAKVENIPKCELHIDTDEEEKYNLHPGDEVEVYPCGK